MSLSKMLSIPRGLLNLFFSLSDREISKQNRACVTTAWLVKPLCALIILLSVQKNLQAESRPRSPLIKPLRALIILLTAHRNLQAESRPRSPLIKPLCALIILLTAHRNLQADSRPRSCYAVVSPFPSPRPATPENGPAGQISMDTWSAKKKSIACSKNGKPISPFLKLLPTRRPPGHHRLTTNFQAGGQVPTTNLKKLVAET